jgi:hypothetical protein
VRAASREQRDKRKARGDEGREGASCAVCRSILFPNLHVDDPPKTAVESNT